MNIIHYYLNPDDKSQPINVKLTLDSDSIAKLKFAKTIKARSSNGLKKYPHGIIALPFGLFSCLMVFLFPLESAITV